MGSEERFELLEVGCYTPKPTALPALHAGEVGYMIAGLKDIEALRVGDTVTDANRPCAEPLKGFKLVQPMVFAGLFPVDAADYQDLKDALGKLKEISTGDTSPKLYEVVEHEIPAVAAVR